MLQQKMALAHQIEAQKRKFDQPSDSAPSPERARTPESNASSMAPKVEVENSAEQSDNEVFEDENKNTEEKNEPENDCCGSHSAHSCHSEGEKSCCETEHEVSVSETDDFSVLKGGEK